MRRFRSRLNFDAPLEPLSLQSLRRTIDELLEPRHFFSVADLRLFWDKRAAAETPWEIFHGRVLDRRLTRLNKNFETWSVFVVDEAAPSAEPLLSVKLDAEMRCVHVVRAIHCHTWEGYDAGASVFLSRETRQWKRELVGTIPCGQFETLDDFGDELMSLIFCAIVGLSRLPLTSEEAPLPQFSLGQLAYCYSPSKAAGGQFPIQTVRELIDAGFQAPLCAAEQSRLLEFVLRAVPTGALSDITEHWYRSWSGRGTAQQLMELLRRVFDDVALSPYTDFVSNTMQFLTILQQKEFITPGQHIDFLSYLLRYLARHLTAYDLITFHHQGANYPDALLLDAALQQFLILTTDHSELFAGTGQTALMRRRALRQAWIVRRCYEGLRVPDAPTSPGENARILPPPHVRVPEEQITNVTQRTKRLFDGDPLDQHVNDVTKPILQRAFEDLCAPSELRELGMAAYLDRPLGCGKHPAEPDHTMLFSYEAFSRTIAMSRLTTLSKERRIRTELFEMLQSLDVAGVKLPEKTSHTRPGVVSLDDARKVAADWVFLRTSQRTVRDFFQAFDLQYDCFDPNACWLIMRGSKESSIVIYDAQYRKRLELIVDARAGFVSRAGIEYPQPGLRLARK